MIKKANCSAFFFIFFYSNPHYLEFLTCYISLFHGWIMQMWPGMKTETYLNILLSSVLTQLGRLLGPKQQQQQPQYPVYSTLYKECNSHNFQDSRGKSLITIKKMHKSEMSLYSTAWLQFKAWTKIWEGRVWNEVLQWDSPVLPDLQQLCQEEWRTICWVVL